jgi:hypothetical protein
MDNEKSKALEATTVSQADIKAMGGEEETNIKIVCSCTEKIGALADAFAKARVEFKKLEQSGMINKTYQKDGKWVTIQIPYSTLKDIHTATKHALQKNGLSVLSQINLNGREIGVVLQLVHGKTEQKLISILSTDVLVIGKQVFLSELGKTKTYLTRIGIEGMLLIPEDDEEPDIIEEPEPKAKCKRKKITAAEEEKASSETISNLHTMLFKGYGLNPAEAKAFIKGRYNKISLSELSKEEAADLDAYLLSNNQVLKMATKKLKKCMDMS